MKNKYSNEDIAKALLKCMAIIEVQSSLEESETVANLLEQCYDIVDDLYKCRDRDDSNVISELSAYDLYE